MSIKQLRKFAYECVDVYSKFNGDHYELTVQNLPEPIQHEFASLIISNDESYASEATGPDNPSWESKMLPTLLHYLKNSTDQDQEVEFKNTWRDCVTDYVRSRMQDLIDDELSNYNNQLEFLISPFDLYGVISHGH